MTAGIEMPLGNTGGADPLPERLRLTKVSKYFGALAALQDVDLVVRQGEIRALLGENGAGKTTLMNVAFGLMTPNAGSIELDGRPVQWGSPRAALEAGVSMVHQHFSLIPSFTVLENLMLGAAETRGGLLNAAGVRARAGELMREHGFDLDFDARLSDLPIAIQQRVEIIRALYQGAKLLIFDEPTAVLGVDDIPHFFTTLRRLRDRGSTIIFISHKLEEVIELCDEITVLRHGRVVGEMAVSEATPSRLAQLMVGRELEPMAVGHDRTAGRPMLEVRGVSYADRKGRRRVDDVTLEVRAGEVLGVAGVAGNGQEELVELITGLARADTGTVSVDGHALGRASRTDFLRCGVVHIPEDRRQHGLVLDLTIEENLVLGSHREARFQRRGLTRAEAIRAYADALIGRYQIQGSAGTPVRSLSGGHQQRVVLARELEKDPKLIVAVQPIRGLDVAASRFVHDLLFARAQAGAACLIVSTDLDELLEISDRLAVMYRGRIVGLMPTSEATWEKLGLLMGGVETNAKAA